MWFNLGDFNLSCHHLVLALSKCYTVGVEVLTSNNFLFTSGLTCIPSITSLCGTSCFISLNSKYVSLLHTRREHHVVSLAHWNGHSKAFFSSTFVFVYLLYRGTCSLPRPRNTIQMSRHFLTGSIANPSFVHSRSNCVLLLFCSLLRLSQPPLEDLLIKLCNCC